ncbi:hypothetical protein B8W70_00630 [Pseudomonas sp. 1239]|jgi:hypothetical protein|uniref:Uncharacterized protein n=2 Tax=Pseudomonas TaxID=286 RepID=A0A0D1MXN7_PSEPU|nr:MULTISPECIES: DUF2790 domain-containing protein [Pseudomonas]KIU53559.1 hypothetical protein QV12_04845 [Pseudomonas putida]MCP8348655.1 DUF2790 domain-containing protein [Pseudomonas sp. FBF18]MDU9392848.1 DUF2790 domain-containing protein [Pseudomonas sp. zfem002]NNJ16741.1 DUF2790 domain-containing protein [Pseudomonas bharatica CSV86]OLS61563.1 hypothetical protein PSEMO_34920 [Pseudomonas putida]
MKKIIVAAALVIFSIASQASTFSEKRQLQYIQEHQTAVAKYAEKNGKPMPEIQDYKYGMKIDVAKFVRQSQDPRTCKVYSRLMTFEDSQGTLKTVRYSLYSQCVNDK